RRRKLIVDACGKHASLLTMGCGLVRIITYRLNGLLRQRSVQPVRLHVVGRQSVADAANEGRWRPKSGVVTVRVAFGFGPSPFDNLCGAPPVPKQVAGRVAK